MTTQTKWMVSQQYQAASDQSIAAKATKGRMIGQAFTVSAKPFRCPLNNPYRDAIGARQ
jgi:hypothetical protein